MWTAVCNLHFKLGKLKVSPYQSLLQILWQHTPPLEVQAKSLWPGSARNVIITDPSVSSSLLSASPEDHREWIIMKKRLTSSGGALVSSSFPLMVGQISSEMDTAFSTGGMQKSLIRSFAQLRITVPWFEDRGLG